MAFNGTGTASLTPTSVAPAVSNTTISSSEFNATTADIVAMFNKTLCRDGQANPTANLPMAGFNHTGVGNATTATHYAAAGQVQAGTMTYAATSVGTDAYAITVTPSIAAYAAGQRFQALIDVANTGACTLNVNSVGAVAIKTQDGADPLTNTILATSVIDVIHDGTNFILLSPVGGNINIAKITASSSTGDTITATNSSTTNNDHVLVASQSATSGSHAALNAANASADGYGIYSYASHLTGANYAGFFQTDSIAGTAGYFTATAAGGIPIQCVSADAADGNPTAVLSKGAYKFHFNPRGANASYTNPIVSDGDQVLEVAGAGGAINTGVLTLAPYATDAVGIRIDSTVDTVTISGTQPTATITTANITTLSLPAIGTWTPTLLDASFSSSEGQTYSNQTGSYYIIGKMLFFTFRINLSSLGTLTGANQAAIGGLPFPAYNSGFTQPSGGAVISAAFNINVTDAAGQGIQCLIPANAQHILLYQMTVGTSSSVPLTITEVTASGNLYGHGQYLLP